MFHRLLILTITIAIPVSVGFAQTSYNLETTSILPPPEVAYAPSPADGTEASYINNEGSFFLAGKDGAAVYRYDNKTYFSKLTCLGPSSLRSGQFVDQGFVYKDSKDPFFLYFSSIAQSVPQGTRYWLYYSFDGRNYTRWLTTTGTSKHAIDDRSKEFVKQLRIDSTSTPGNQPNPGNVTDAPDGKVAKLPWTGSASTNGGSANVTVLPEGIISIRLKGRHSGVTGRTKYSCAVVVSGYKNGQPFTILNRADTETLTVGANSFTGTASKDKSFTQRDSFSPNEAKNIRNVRILLVKDKSGDNFVDTVKGMLQAASDIFDEAESLYKKIKQSEIGADVATAAAGG